MFRLSFKSSSGPQGTDPKYSKFRVHIGIPKCTIKFDYFGSVP